MQSDNAEESVGIKARRNYGLGLEGCTMVLLTTLNLIHACRAYALLRKW